MAKDKYHNFVREALEKDGWIITHDPFFIWVGRRKGFIDLGAEKDLIAAEKGKEKIAVEIKSFVSTSDLDAFEDALGQFLIYLMALEEKEPERVLYLAIPESFHNRFFDDPFFARLANRFQVKMVIYNEVTKNLIEWKK